MEKLTYGDCRKLTEIATRIRSNVYMYDMNSECVYYNFKTLSLVLTCVILSIT